MTEIEIEVQLNEFDSAVARQLAHHEVARDDETRSDKNSIVRSPRNQLRKRVELHRESIDDPKKIKDLEVVCRRLTGRTSFIAELAIKILEELQSCPDLASPGRHF